MIIRVRRDRRRQVSAGSATKPSVNLERSVDERVVTPRFEPKIVTQEFGASAPVTDVAELMMLPGVTEGADGIAGAS
jgi:hypothetical protein